MLIALLLVAPLLLTSPVQATQAQTAPDVYVGIDVGYGINAQEAKQVINQVCNYTNFFVLGNYGLSLNITQLNETLQYAYDKGMYFMSYPPSRYGRSANVSLEWLNYTREHWGNHLVGFLYPYEDEPGGHQLDRYPGQYRPVDVMQNTSYVDAEQQYIEAGWFLDLNQTKNFMSYPLFTSDYALYWFDYKGGYDGLFAEFGWNYSRQINVALCRGAATMQNKEWGVIITYTYTHPPYMESGDQLYEDLVYAYENGAKYIVVLDTNENWTNGALTEEHYQALQHFWEYTKSHPRQTYPVYERVAYALPESYAYGFRGPTDSIWGVWPADETAVLISTSVSIMLEKYGNKLDIIYNEPNQTAQKQYGYLVQWNNPEEVVDQWPTLSPSPSATQTPSPSATQTPSPSPTITTTQTVTPTKTQQPTTTATATQPPTNEPYWQNLFLIAAAIIAVTLTLTVLAFKRKLTLNHHR
jgi:hypothetical protein